LKHISTVEKYLDVGCSEGQITTAVVDYFKLGKDKSPYIYKQYR
jgi:hypothetical protein